MSEYNDYIDTVIAESYSISGSDLPEPPDSWTLEDFQDVIRSDTK